MPTMSVSNDDDCVPVELEIDRDELGSIDEIVKTVELLKTSLIEAVVETGLKARL